MTAALAISLLLHAVVAALLSLKRAEQSRPPSATVVEVQLKRFTPSKPDKSVTAPVQPTRDSTPQPRRKSEQRPASVSQPAPRDWSQEIREVARAQSDSTASRYVPPATRNAGLGPAPELRLPELAASFRPPLPGKICGKEVEFEVGMHKFTMPVSYPCHDKQEEYRDAIGSTKGGH